MINKGKLIPRKVVVRGKDGKTYMATRYVDPNKDNHTDNHTSITDEPMRDKIDQVIKMNDNGNYQGRNKDWQKQMANKLGLKLLGGGSNKAVFEYGDKVLKVASHPYGKNDCENEYHIYHTADDETKEYLVPIHEAGNGWGIYDKVEHAASPLDSELIEPINSVVSLFKEKGYNISDLDVDHDYGNIENWGVLDGGLVALDYAEMGTPKTRKSLYINLAKGFGRLNTAKLVRKMVTVKGKNGRTFKRMQWVKPWEASTGHGVRAIHNIFDLDNAKEDGVHVHPDFHEALEHQGIFNAHNMYEGMHHEHPVYLPETSESAQNAKDKGRENHIPHGASEYNRHNHTNAIYYSNESNDDLEEETDEDGVIHIPGDSRPEHMLSHEELNEKKIRDIVRQRTPGRPIKQKGVSEQAKPLDFEHIKLQYPGHTIGDMLMDGDEYSQLHEDHKQDIKMQGDDFPTDLKHAWVSAQDIFGDMPVPAIEHVFSHPNGDYTAHLREMTPRVDQYGHTKFHLDFSLRSKDDEPIGTCTRKIYRQPNGNLYVYNDMLSIHNGTENGVGKHLYHRTDQLWSHLAGEGRRVELGVFANISIGRYAWATKDKGFDFQGTFDRDCMRSELRDFIKLNGWDESEVMKSCGYRSVDDLSHAWQFASLDDGFTYDLTPHKFKKSRHDDEYLKGKVGLGKAFMLTSVESWSGIKFIDPDGSIAEQDHIDRLVDKHLMDTGDYDYLLDDDDDDDDEDLYSAMGTVEDVGKSMSASEPRQFKARKLNSKSPGGREGLSLDSNGNTIKDDSWLHPSVGLKKI